MLWMTLRNFYSYLIVAPIFELLPSWIIHQAKFTASKALELRQAAAIKDQPEQIEVDFGCRSLWQTEYDQKVKTVVCNFSW